MSAAAKIAQVGGGVKNLAIGLAVVGAVAGVVYVAIKVRRAAAAAGKAAGEVVDWGRDVANRDLNPTSDQNLAYRGVNEAGAAISGDSDFSLGTWLYDVTHPNSLTRTLHDGTKVY